MTKPEVSSYIGSKEKRALDLAAASSVGVLAITGGAIAESLLIAANHWVTPIFRQDRVGKGGEEFKVFKFRTWDYDGSKLIHADRVRNLGLDESPQFLNVLSGEMSAVGYRPITARDLNHAAQRLRTHYTEASPFHPNRWFELREQGNPGVTGPTQTMPLRPDAGSLEHLVDVVSAETEFMRTDTLALDIRYLIKTPPTIVVGHNPTVAKSYLATPES